MSEEDLKYYTTASYSIVSKVASDLLKTLN